MHFCNKNKNGLILKSRSNRRLILLSLFLSFFFSFFLPHILGGNYVELNGDIRDYLNKKLNLPIKLQLFTDTRKYPVIDLRDIIVQLFFMPFFGMTSLLNLDRISRKKSYKKLFRCKRKMVSSDTTIKRVLNWIHAGESRLFLLSFLPFMEENGLLQKMLTPSSNTRRLGIFDGSVMGGHYHETFTLSGMVNYPIFIEDCGKKGEGASYGLLNYREEL